MHLYVKTSPKSWLYINLCSGHHAYMKQRLGRCMYFFSNSYLMLGIKEKQETFDNFFINLIHSISIKKWRKRGGVMKKCIKLMFEVDNSQKVLETFVAKQAEKFHIEGIGQQMKDGFLQIYACAQEEQIEEFIDCLYLGSKVVQLKNIEIETCSTERSYRGVFRVVE